MPRCGVVTVPGKSVARESAYEGTTGEDSRDETGGTFEEGVLGRTSMQDVSVGTGRESS